MSVYSDNLKLFKTAQMTLGTSFSPTQVIGRKIYRFDADDADTIPFTIRTGQQAFGDISERKEFRYLEFHTPGSVSGTFNCRIYIDGRYVCDGRSTSTENTGKLRKVNLPIGKRIGYTIDVEFAGDKPIRSIEFTYNPVGSS